MGSNPMAAPGSHFARQQRLMRFLTSASLQPMKEAHAHQSHLTPAAGEALVNWNKEMGRRGIPLHPSTVALNANAISGAHIGEHWVA